MAKSKSPKKGKKSGKDDKSKSGKNKDSESKKKTSDEEIDPAIASLWAENIIATVLNDGKWKCNITLLQESSADISKYIEWFEDGVKIGTRRIIKNISYAETMLELKMAKGKKGLAKTHPLQGVCTEASSQLAKDGTLPLDLLAKLIKYKLIRFKEADLASKRAKVIQEIEDRKMMAQKRAEHDEMGTAGTSPEGSEGKESKGDKGKGKGKGKGEKSKTKEGKGGKKSKKGGSEKKGGKGKKKKDKEGNECWDGKSLEPIETKEKWNTKLHLRGEQHSTHIIEDFPKDGADLYVVMTGFWDPQMFVEFLNIAIPINSIIKIKPENDSSPSSIDIVDSFNQTVLLTSVKSKEPGTPKRNASMYESPCGVDIKHEDDKMSQPMTLDAFTEKMVAIEDFWKRLQKVANKQENLLMFKDVAFVTFPTPPAIVASPTNPVDILKNQNTMYDEVSQMMYDMEDVSKQHVNYIRHMTLVSLEPKCVVDHLNGMDIYKSMVQLLPMESQSVDFIMHCILEQVDALCTEPDVLEILEPQPDVVAGSVLLLPTMSENPTLNASAVDEAKVSEHTSGDEIPTPGQKGSKEKENNTETSTRNQSKLSLKSNESNQQQHSSHQRVSQTNLSKTSLDRSKSLSQEASRLEEAPCSELDMSLPQPSKVEVMQETLQSRIEELNKVNNLFQLAPPRALKQDPLVILHGDLSTLKLFHCHVTEIDLATAFEYMVTNGSIPWLWRQYDVHTPEENEKYDFHIHQLWKCMEGRSLTLRMLKNHLHLLLFEKMECSSVVNLNVPWTGMKRKVSSLHDSGHMGFSEMRPVRRMRNKLASALCATIKTPVSDPDMESVNQLNNSHLGGGHLSKMESIGEMFESEDIVCLTDPIKYVLTGVRPTVQRASVLDLHKYNVVEEFNSNIMMQNIQDAFFTFNCIDYQHYAPTDVILLNFHNCKDKQGILVDKWVLKLTSPVGFRDFCEYVYDEEAAWFQEQELLFEKMELERLEKALQMEGIYGMTEVELKTGEAEESAGDNEDLSPFIKFGSIKFKELLKKRLEEQKKIDSQPLDVEGKDKKKSKKEGSKKGSKKDKADKKEKGKGQKGKVDKKTKEPKGKKGKKGGKDTKASKAKSVVDEEPETVVEIPYIKRPSLRCARSDEEAHFRGYDLGPLHFQIHGYTSYFYCPDGSSIRSVFHEWLYKDKQLLKVVAEKHGHQLYFYSFICEEEFTIESPLVFHVVSTQGVVLAFSESIRIATEPVDEPTVEAAVVDGDITEPTREPSSTSHKEKGSSKHKKIDTQQGDDKSDLTRQPSGMSNKAKGSSKHKKIDIQQGDDNSDLTRQPSAMSNKAKGSSKHKKTEKKKSSDSQTTKNKSKRKKSGKTQQQEETPAAEEQPEEVAPTQPPVEPLDWKYDFKASWPSGLCVETVTNTEKRDPFKIKQTYLQKGPECKTIQDEDYRMFLRNGTILKFMSNGFVEVLSPNSQIIVCKHFSKPELQAPLTPMSMTPRPPKTPECPEDIRLDGEEWSPVAQTNMDEAKGKLAREAQEKALAAKLAAINALPKPEMEVVHYHVVEPNGNQFTVNESILDETCEKFLFRVATDYELGEVFTRRGDGTNTLLMRDCRLIVVFPDGSRITTSYSVDEELVTLEWTDEEILEVTLQIRQREEEERQIQEERDEIEKTSKQSLHSKRESFTGSLSKRELPGSKQILSKASLDSLPKKTQSRLSTFASQGRISVVSAEQAALSACSLPADGVKATDRAMFEDEGFVSIRFNCCLEHPNYATVSYTGEDQSADIDMPYEMSVHVSANGRYLAKIDPETDLDVTEDTIQYDCRICPNCAALNATTIHLSGFRPSPEPAHPKTPFCVTNDPWGHCYTVALNGDANLYNSNDAAGKGEKEDSVTNYPCLPALKSNNRRCFAVHRDLAGQEFINTDEVQANLQDTRNTVGACVVEDRIPGESGYRYYTSLTPVTKTESQNWLMEYKSKYILPHHMRKKHLRSTYGDPPGWFHPFPKNRTAVLPPEPDKGGGGDEITAPDVYVLRILQEMELMKEGSENIIADIQEGLMMYWNAAAVKFEEYLEHPIQDPRTEEELEIEEYLFKEALGQSPVSVPELLRRGRRSLDPTFDVMEKLQTRARAHASYMEKLQAKKAQDEADKETYKAILRNKYVPPYFKSVAGESFTAVLKTMNDAVSLAEQKQAGDGRTLEEKVEAGGGMPTESGDAQEVGGKSTGSGTPKGPDDSES